MKKVCAVILGGGRGTRLFPLTAERSKPAVPFGAEFRLIDIPMSNCINSGIDNIFVLTQFLMASLQKHIYQTYKFDNFSNGFVEVLSAEQTNESMAWYQGTADAVRKQRHHFLLNEYDHILILSGDHLYQMHYDDFLQYHIEKSADITVGAYPVAVDKVSGFGILQANSESKITNFFEKPKDPSVVEKLRISGLVPEEPDKQFLASMGIYVFSRDVLRYMLEESDEDDFGAGIIPQALGRFSVYSYLYDGYWEDIGTIRAFYEANLGLTNPVPNFNLYDPNFPLYSRPRFLAPTKITSGASLHDSIVGNGSLVEDANILHSVVGIRSIVRKGVSLKHSVLMGADYYEFNNLPNQVPLGIGENTVIENAIVDKNARIGNDCQIVNLDGAREKDGDNYYIRDGITIIPKNSTIPPGTRI